MTLGVTIARKGEKWEVVSDPNTNFSEQRRQFGEVCKVAASNGYDEVQLLSSSLGRVRRKKIRKRESRVASPEVLSAPVDAPKTTNAPVVLTPKAEDDSDII